MIAVDTNILVYAHRADSPWHDRASQCLKELAEGNKAWMIPWPCVHEFLAIVTHPRIYKPPTPLHRALEQIQMWMESPALVLAGESSAYWPGFKQLIQNSRCIGPSVHDARVAAICLESGVDLLLTADRDFGKFPGLKVRNPLFESGS